MESFQLFIIVIFLGIPDATYYQRNPSYYNLANFDSETEGIEDDIGQDTSSTRPLEQYYIVFIDPTKGDGIDATNLLMRHNNIDKGDGNNSNATGFISYFGTSLTANTISLK